MKCKFNFIIFHSPLLGLKRLNTCRSINLCRCLSAVELIWDVTKMSPVFFFWEGLLEKEPRIASVLLRGVRINQWNTCTSCTCVVKGHTNQRPKLLELILFSFSWNMLRSIATPPWTGSLSIDGLPPPPPPHNRVLPVPIYTHGWRETKWSKVPCLRKQCGRWGLNPRLPDPDFAVLSARPVHASTCLVHVFSHISAVY